MDCVYQATKPRFAHNEINHKPRSAHDKTNHKPRSAHSKINHNTALQLEMLCDEELQVIAYSCLGTLHSKACQGEDPCTADAKVIGEMVVNFNRDV